MHLWLNTGLYRVPVIEHLDRGDNSKFHHVSCPIHTLLNKVGLYRIRYFDCPECDWQQFGDSTECAVSEDHEGWVRDRIERYYKMASERHDRAYMNVGGYIAKGIREKYGFPRGEDI